jgi:hypothetical protein
MAASPQTRKAIADSENALRDTLWTDAADRLWAHKTSGGFVTTPKTMPYVCRILDEMSKDHPLASTYEALWSYTWANNAFLRFNKPDDVTFAAGFSGQRGRRTLLERMRRLQLLGFIETQPNGNETFGFIFLPNPHAVLFRHQTGQGTPLPDPAPKGLSTHIVPASWNAFVARALDLGCKDVKLLLNPPPPSPVSAAVPAVPAALTSPKVLRRRPKAAAKA